MNQSLEAIQAELRRDGFADAVHEPGTEQRVREAIARHRADGLNAYVVRAEPGRPLGELRPLWERLGLNEATDLLLLHNGTRWEAKGWALSAEQIGGALDGAESELRRDAAGGFVLALDRLAELVPRSEFPWAAAGAGAVMLVGVGWVLARRRKLAGERRQRIAAAVASAEAVQADVMLAAEQLPADAAAEVQLRAASLGEAVRRVADDESEAAAVGRITQLESELNALHSDVMARAHRERSNQS